jgi:hypothetical protein
MQNSKLVTKYRRQAEEYFSKCKICPEGEEIVDYVADCIEARRGVFMDQTTYEALAKQMGIDIK